MLVKKIFEKEWTKQEKLQKILLQSNSFLSYYLFLLLIFKYFSWKTMQNQFFVVPKTYKTKVELNCWNTVRYICAVQCLEELDVLSDARSAEINASQLWLYIISCTLLYIKRNCTHTHCIVPNCTLNCTILHCTVP